MAGKTPIQGPDGESPQRLKRVSRIKHEILQNYFPAWANILGSQYSRLAYVDCFAGPGRYELDGKPVEGSPLIAIKAGIEFVRKRPGRTLLVILVEDDPEQLKWLEASLDEFKPYPSMLQVEVRQRDSQSYLPNLLNSLRNLGPAFFLVDPYGHPLPIRVINEMLDKDRCEVLVNLMWFRITMDLENSVMKPRLDDLFGNSEWRTQPFMHLHGLEREKQFVDFFISKLHAKFVLPFKIRYDPEDKIGGNRTKYYLLHASNHKKAVLLMKAVMWPLGDQEGTFDFSGTSQGVLISETPTEGELEVILKRKFKGRELEFGEICAETWELPFIEKHYRNVIKTLEKRQEVIVIRITSKQSGISDRDRVRFK